MTIILSIVFIILGLVLGLATLWVNNGRSVKTKQDLLDELMFSNLIIGNA